MPNADTQALQATALAGATELIREGLKPRTIRVRPPAFAVRFSNGQWSIVDEFVVGPSGPGPSERSAHLSATELIIFADERTVDGILNRLPSPTMSAPAPLRADPEETLFSAQGEFKFLKEAFAKAGRAEGLIEFSAADGQTNAEPQNVKKAIVILRELQGDIAVRMDENRRRVDR